MNKNIIALGLFLIGTLLINYWTFNMLKEFEILIRIVGQISINIPLIFLFFSSKMYDLKERE